MNKKHATSAHDGPGPALTAFVSERQAASPVENYEELQTVLRGETNVPELLADYVRTYGGQETTKRGQDIVRLAGQCGRYALTAILCYEETDSEYVVMLARKRMFPILRYKNVCSAILRTKDPTWDQAVTYRPRYAGYLPNYHSPDIVNAWANRGDQRVFSGEGSKTAARLAEEAAAAAPAVFNGYLDTTVWLMDHLLRAKHTDT